MSADLRCLSIRQPWAWAIVSGVKDIENRTWTTEFRGRIVIHAGVNKDDVRRQMEIAGPKMSPLDLAYGAFIGVAELVQVEPLNARLEANPWAWGPYCWQLANPRRFREPIVAKGKLNLYSLPADLANRVEAAVALAEPVQRDERVAPWAARLADTGDERGRVLGLFDAYVKLGDGDNALRMARRSYQLKPDADAFVDCAVAKSLLETPDFVGALEDLDHAILMNPKGGRAYHVRSIVYRTVGQLAKSRADAAAAKKLGFE